MWELHIIPNTGGIVPMPSAYVGDEYSVLQYSYNDKGYITQKQDTKTGQSESYSYDALGRLTAYTVNNTVQRTFNYANNGNMTQNSGVGSNAYSYSAGLPHAVSNIVADTGVISSVWCNTTYNERNRPASIGQGLDTILIGYGDGLDRDQEIWKQGSAVQRTVNFLFADCEEEVSGSVTRYVDYLMADGRVVALHVKNGTADSIYYVHTDMLGSWERIVNTSDAVVQISHFDPWGNRMNAGNWTAKQDGTNFVFRRGFTGHEHYDQFKVINMNARLYDPVIGRFFSPDPQVQNPYSTQGLNRYSYCGNNPVMYSDPTGELFAADSWIFGFIHGFFSTGSNRWQTALNTANRLAKNDIKIWGGLFVTDPNKSFMGQCWEVASRFLWQTPQTLAGFALSQFANASEWLGFTNGGIQSISYLYGATAVTYNVGGWGAITLGSFINGDNQLRADPCNHLFQHEYGHYIQSQNFGIFYLSRYGIPSGLNCLGDKNHDNHPVEQDANIRAFKYFNKYIDSYSGWDFDSNPIIGYDNSLPYNNPYNQTVLNNGLIRPVWYNYLFTGEIIITGIINWISLENYED
jgi:RHS repeat-associated protein